MAPLLSNGGNGVMHMGQDETIRRVTLSAIRGINLPHLDASTPGTDKVHHTSPHPHHTGLLESVSLQIKSPVQ